MVLLESLKIPLGTTAADFSLKGVDGKFYSLENFKDAEVLVIVFMCNHCPYVQAVWDRLVKLQARYKDQGVQFVGINPNTANQEYADEENLEKMREYYQRYNMNFPYLEDRNQSVASEYKAQCTPDIYVFDAERKLAYHGRIDDSWRDESKVSKEELAEAIGQILSGKSVPPPRRGRPVENQKPSMGCSIKWV